MSEELNELPKGWARCELLDVTEPSKEKAQPVEFTNSHYIGLEHIGSGNNKILGSGNTNGVKSTKSVFKAKDILYGKLRPYLNKVCQPSFDGVCSTDIIVYPQSPLLENKLLLHFLSMNSTSQYATQNSNGINLPRINPKTLGEIEFNLPPLNEQKRIVKKIESLQARSQRSREALAEVGPLLEQFRQSVLAAAFRGDLTADWRAENPDVEPASVLLDRIRQERRQKWEADEQTKYEAKNKKPPKNWQDKYKEPEPIRSEELAILSDQSLPDSWSWAPAELIVEPDADIVYGIVQPGKKLEQGVPYVRGKDIINGKILVDQLLKTSEKIAAKYERASLKGDDVLLGIIRATKVAIVPDELEGANITQGTARFRPSNIIGTKFLAGWLDSPYAQNWLHDHYRGIDMPGLNLRDVRRLPIPIAPLPEQVEVEEKVAATMGSVVKAKLDVAESEYELDQLDQSILSKAFRGELVPQDPNDEPAAELLAWIKAAREAEQATRKKRPTKRKQKKTSGRT